ncbi:integrase [Thioclava sp. BHET1]|nr:integrase [Thioclava sp. BHET1]
MPDRRASADPAQGEAFSKNTRAAYATDWALFTRWCRLNGIDPLAPSPEIMARYLSGLASPEGSRGVSASTIERRLSGLVWNYAQRDLSFDRKNHELVEVLAQIKRNHARPPVRKEALRTADILAMITTLPFDLRGLRDRAILLLGYAGGLRRSEIVGLDMHQSDTPDGRGWVEISEPGARVVLSAKTGLREFEIGRGRYDASCPVHALEHWLKFSKIRFGPIFTATTRNGKTALKTRLNDKHVARLIKRTARDAKIRSELSDAERAVLFSGDSLREGLAATLALDGPWRVDVSGEDPTRTRFQTNLTKAAGL